MKETIETLENLRDLLRSKKAQAVAQSIDPDFKGISEQLTGAAMAYGDAVLLVGEEIIKVLNNTKKLA